MDGNINVMGVVITDGKPKEIQEKLDALAKMGMKLSPLPDGGHHGLGSRETAGPIWRFPFPGIPVPYLVRNVWEQKGYVNAAIEGRAPAQVVRFKVDPDIRGGIRNYHVHLGNEIVMLDAQTFERLVRAAAAELMQQREANAIGW
jgi:hypothetical protein